MFNNSTNHSWGYKEDFCCCKEIIENYVIKRYEAITPETIANDVKKQYSDLKISSIIMRFQNIKYLLERNNIPNTLKIKSLEHYANQTEQAFVDACKQYGIITR